MIDTQNKKIFIFDLDGTLAPSKSALEAETAKLLAKLLQDKKVVIISGGAFEQFLYQFISHLSVPEEHLKNLYLLPVTGSQEYVYMDGAWVRTHEENPLEGEEKKRILDALKYSIEASDIAMPGHLYGSQIEDRGSQITFSALGQAAPSEEKEKWDPDHSKREKIISHLKTQLPEGCPIRIGGMTSIDIGWDKGRALERFFEIEKINKSDVVFFGDAIFPGGNDYPAQEIGLDCVAVKNPAETRAYLETMLK